MKITQRDRLGRIVGRGKAEFVCDYCSIVFKDYQSNKTGKAKLCSRKCFGLWRSKNIYGENHPKWKGDDVGYYALHSWVRRQISAIKCEYCGSVENLDMANKSREYKRDLSDWIVLCGKCHTKYDGHKRWANHILNKEKKCHCGMEVKARNLCSLHYNRLNLYERGLIYQA